MAVEALRAWIRGADVADVPALALLHRELWIDHDARGGMPASDDDDVWDGYADLLATQLSSRRGRRAPSEVFDGRVGHLIAEHQGRLVGQVEVALERYGFADRTPHVAELRSLIVSQRARGLGLGEDLVRSAAIASRARVDAPTLIVAEVLARNEALRFYERLGFRTLERLIAIAVAPPVTGRWTVETARPRDAAGLTVLDHEARRRRHAFGDVRYDPPTPGVGGDLVRIIADSLVLDAAARSAEPERLRDELVVCDERGRICGAAYLVSTQLGAPFVALTRAEVSRIAVDPSHSAPTEVATAALAEAFTRAQRAGANQLLVRASYLDPIGAFIAGLAGARPFSWILAAMAGVVAGDGRRRA